MLSIGSERIEMELGAAEMSVGVDISSADNLSQGVVTGVVDGSLELPVSHLPCDLRPHKGLAGNAETLWTGIPTRSLSTQGNPSCYQQEPKR